MRDIELETTPPEVEEEEPESRTVSIFLNIHEAEGTAHGATTYLQEETATPDEVADALIRCAQAVAGLRGSDTLVALQSRLMQWGQS